MRQKLTAVAILLFAASPVFATKPCPQSPCFSQLKFDKEKCVAAADWITTGQITEVIHNYKGEPLNKDFASFIFKIKTQEKGNAAIQKELRFTVGWCDNSKSLPEDISGFFRFYGITYKSTDTKTDNYEYLHFEKINP